MANPAKRRAKADLESPDVSAPDVTLLKTSKNGSKQNTLKDQRSKSVKSIQKLICSWFLRVASPCSSLQSPRHWVEALVRCLHRVDRQAAGRRGGRMGVHKEREPMLKLRGNRSHP